MNLTTTEITELQKLTKKFKYKDIDTDKNVQVITSLSSSPELKKWVDGYCKRNNLKLVLDSPSGLFVFETVGMHVDGYAKNSLACVIPLHGSGELFHFQNDEIRETKFRQYDPILFNDNKPHSFTADNRCLALIFSIENEDIF